MYYFFLRFKVREQLGSLSVEFMWSTGANDVNMALSYSPKQYKFTRLLTMKWLK